MALATEGLSVVDIVSADPSPNGPGQPCAPGATCNPSNSLTSLTPGGPGLARGSPFNPDGVAGTVYAGNPGTASLLHANSIHEVSQYDIAKKI